MIYIGIDGGGSKTKLRMLDQNGQRIAESIAGPSNIRLSVNIACESIENAFQMCLKQAGILPSQLKNYSFHAGIGLAGCELKSAREAFLKNKFPFETVTLKSDAYTACMGAHGGKNGAVVIAGTGVVGLKIVDGVKTQVGGWGFPHGDEGGGAWLGLEGVKNLLHYLDSQQKRSSFLNALKKKLGSTRENIADWACNAGATQYAELTPLIVNYAKKNDLLAVTLLKQAAKHIEDILILFLEHQEEKLPCAFIGGIAPILLEYMKKSLRKKISPALHDACQGAIFMITRK